MKKKPISRILTGLIAGMHYVHAISTYSHKKYNTQEVYPKTLECYLGGSLACLFILTYFYLAVSFSWLFLLFPLITNAIAYLIKIKKIKQ